MAQGLRVVVADDSALFRKLLTQVLQELGGVDVVDEVGDGRAAIERVRRSQVDVLTLDLNMPELDGLGTLRELKKLKLEVEILVVAASTPHDAEVTLEALELGAVDFILKPASESSAASTAELAGQLKRQLAAIRLRRDTLARRRERSGGSGELSRVVPAGAPAGVSAQSGPRRVIAMGASTGGPKALHVVLAALPEDLPVPMLIVQHMPPAFTASLAESLDKKCALHVVEAHHGQKLDPGSVYIAPGGKQMSVKVAFDGVARVLVSDDPPENHCRPSVDTLFRSVAEEFGGAAVAVILTGMGNDGVAGLGLLKARGAVVFAQDELSCTVFGMPKEAIRAGVVDEILPIDRIAAELIAAVDGHAR